MKGSKNVQSSLVRSSDGSTAVLLISDEERQQLYERAKAERSKKTPPKQIKQKGGYNYAEFAYMLDEMDRLHPLRSEIITSDEFNEKYLIYNVRVQVTDITTGESRAGVDTHAVVAYNAKSDGGGLKDPSTFRELMGNAHKAALTKALRNAYSNFGVAADLYQTFLAEESTKVQKERFYEFDKFIDEKVIPNSERAQMWWKQIRQEWEQQDETTADMYLDSLQPTITKLKEQYV